MNTMRIISGAEIPVTSLETKNLAQEGRKIAPLCAELPCRPEG
jgi:hypothetical protein